MNDVPVLHPFLVLRLTFQECELAVSGFPSRNFQMWQLLQGVRCADGVTYLQWEWGFEPQIETKLETGGAGWFFLRAWMGVSAPWWHPGLLQSLPCIQQQQRLS